MLKPTTKNGVLKLKRIKAALALLRGEKAQINFEALNLADCRSSLATVIAVLFLVSAILFSCKSAPEQTPGVRVSAFDTLEQDSIVYIRIPVKVHKELTTNILKAVVGQDTPEKYLKNIMDNIDTVYIGAGAASSKARLQIACDGNLSSSAKMALYSASNWTKQQKSVNANGNYTVYSESSSGMELCVPSNNLVCLSTDLVPQLTNYDNEANLISNNEEWKNGEIYGFVGNPKTDNVRIFMNNPLSFVTRLLGVSLSTSIFQLNYIESDMQLLPNGRYAIDLIIEFSKPGLVNKAAGFLNVVFLLTGSKLSIVDDTHINVTDIQVSVEQLQKILGI